MNLTSGNSDKRTCSEDFPFKVFHATLSGKKLEGSIASSHRNHTTGNLCHPPSHEKVSRHLETG